MSTTAPTLRRLPVLAVLALTSLASLAQAPAGTVSNPSYALTCFAVVPSSCPVGFPCGPGTGLGMSQAMGDATPQGLTSGGAYAPLLAQTPGSGRLYNSNVHVPDLRMLAPASLSGMRVGSAQLTLYRGARLDHPVADQASASFAAGSLPSMSRVSQFALASSPQPGPWLVTFDVQGSVSRKLSRGGGLMQISVSFRAGCWMPVQVETWQHKL